MDNFINRIFSKEPSSADKAKDRLRLVLINDRTDLSAAAMDNLKDDLLEVLSRYIQIDRANPCGSISPRKAASSA